MSDGTNEKVTFESLVPKNVLVGYMNYYEGYDGFDYTDMVLLTRKGAHSFGSHDDGYNNVLHGDAEIYINGGGGNFNAEYGWITSSAPDETFNLKSGIFAAGNNNALAAQIYAFDQNGQMTGQVNRILDNTATTIDFANYGNTFRHVSTIEFVGYANVSDDAIVMDNLRVHWNGPIPHGGGASPPHLPVHRHAPHIAHALLSGTNQAHHEHPGSDEPGANLHSHHSELMSLAAVLGHADPGGGLTAQFALPQDEHFGT